MLDRPKVCDVPPAGQTPQGPAAKSLHVQVLPDPISFGGDTELLVTAYDPGRSLGSAIPLDFEPDAGHTLDHAAHPNGTLAHYPWTSIHGPGPTKTCNVVAHWADTTSETVIGTVHFF